mmetsp:Transcript_67324/g.146729  ORF Transcript_67324/g.146729 Transcript_67324/m.146729 type:complete len:204 (-) Transcript_67324:662-1273(-)
MHPGTTVVVAGLQHPITILSVTEGQAHVSVKHHLVVVLAPDVATLPLVLPHAITRGLCTAAAVVDILLHAPSLGEDGDEVVVVKTAAVFRVAPPAAVARVLSLRPAQGMYAHQSGSLRPAEAKAIYEAALDSQAALLRVGQGPPGEGTSLEGRCAAVAEEAPEILCKMRFAFALGQEGHHRLRRDDDEVRQGDLAAEVPVGIV